MTAVGEGEQRGESGGENLPFLLRLDSPLHWQGQAKWAADMETSKRVSTGVKEKVINQVETKGISRVQGAISSSSDSLAWGNGKKDCLVCWAPPSDGAVWLWRRGE